MGRHERLYVVVKIERVSLEYLPDAEKALQPQGGSIEPEPKNYDVVTGTWKDGPARTYWRQKLNSRDQPTKVRFVHLGGEDGQWQISHQFSEHGVFYVSIFVCPEASRAACDSFSADHLIPPREPTSTDDVDSNAFTVCPQGTVSSVIQNQLVQGSQLQTCQAPTGFFSALGKGRIASACPEGFQCNFGGSTWPVAVPGNWVGEYYATDFKGRTRQWSRVPETLNCKSLGACPGSNDFASLYTTQVKKNICPSPDPTDYVMSNFEGFVPPASGAFGQEPCFIMPAPSDSPGCTSPGWQGNGMGSCCKDLVGSRCCPGNTGHSCETCCTSSMGGEKNPSCGFHQWHQVTTGEGKHCAPCPVADSNGSYVLAVVGLLIFFGFFLVAAGGRSGRSMGCRLSSLPNVSIPCSHALNPMFPCFRCFK